MNSNHVQNSHNMHHDHSKVLGEVSISPKRCHLSTNDDQSMMKMYFHTGFIETILFDPWTTTSVPLFIGSWIFIFILGILYEGIRELRQSLEEERLIKRPIISDNGNEHELECINTESPESTFHIQKKIPQSYTERALHGILYAVGLALSYILMLIAMTFNVYLFFAIIFGVGTGHLLFTWSRIISSTSKNQSRA